MEVVWWKDFATLREGADPDDPANWEIYYNPEEKSVGAWLTPPLEYADGNIYRAFFSYKKVYGGEGLFYYCANDIYYHKKVPIAGNQQPPEFRLYSSDFAYEYAEEIESAVCPYVQIRPDFIGWVYRAPYLLQISPEPGTSYYIVEEDISVPVWGQEGYEYPGIICPNKYGSGFVQIYGSRRGDPQYWRWRRQVAYGETWIKYLEFPETKTSSILPQLTALACCSLMMVFFAPVVSVPRRKKGGYYAEK